MEVCEGNMEGGLLYWELWKLGLISTRRKAWKLILGLSLTVKTKLLSFNKTQSGLFTGHNNLRRYFYLMGLTNSPLCRRCGTEEETSDLILCECKALASLRHTYLGSFSWTQRMLRLSTSGGHLELQWRNKIPWLGNRLRRHKGPV